MPFPRRSLFRLGLILASLPPLASALLAQVTDPKITEWVTARSYARVYTTAANRTAGTSATTWSGVTSPFYSDIQRVVYSNTHVYLYTTGMPSYIAGNWLTPNGQQYMSWPKNRAAIHRVPRTVAIPATKPKTNGSGGVLLNGVFVWANGDAQSYDNTGSPNATTATIAMTGDGIWNRLAGVAEGFNFDPAMGHHPSNGAYHNHVNPLGLRYQLGDHVSYNSSTKVYAEITATAPTAHSPLLGFANDGLPIYGPYGYATATDAGSGIRRMTSGFVKRDGQTTNLTTGLPNTNLSASGGVTGRTTLPVWAASVQGKSTTLASTEYGPRTDATYAAGPVNVICAVGLFAEDYDYLGDLGYTQGTHFDLNRQNVRYCVTPEYPSGTYAYFVSIDATGATFFPDIINQEFYGATAPGQGTVTSIAEPVTEYVRGGQASPLTLSATAASPSGVTLTWPSVEGATYTAASSTDGTTFTTLSATLTSTLGGIATYTTATVAAHYRITLTALATYDTLGNGGVSGLNTFATTTYSLPNSAPTLTTITDLADGTEDTSYSITYDALAAAANEADANGDTLSFRVEETFSGSLTKNGVTVVAGTLLSTGDTFLWTPPGNGNGPHTAMTVTAYDGALASSTPLGVQAYIAPVNDAPTLTSVNTLTGATEETPFVITYATLAAAADEADIEGTTLSFRIESVTTGSLVKSGSLVTPGTTTVATGETLVWVPATNANGTLAAFTVTAYDGTDASATAIPVFISTAAVYDGGIWDGEAGTGDWGTGANWVDNTVPLSTDGAAFNGVAPFSITLGADRTIGSVYLGGTNAYTLSGNTLTLGSGGTLGTSPSSGSLTHTIASALTLAGNNTATITQSANLLLSGTITGGTLTKGGLGTLIVSGNAAMTGITTVSAGTLQIGNGGTTGSIAGDVAIQGFLSTLKFNRSDDSTFSGVISGTGSLAKLGAGKLTLTSGGHDWAGLFLGEGTLEMSTGLSQLTIFTIASGATFNLAAGASLETNAFQMGTGTLAATANLGAGASLIVVDNLSLGTVAAGTDTLNVSPGATLLSQNAYLAEESGSIGIINLNGATWTNSGTLRQSDSENTDTTVLLNITGGGSVSTSTIVPTGAWTTTLDNGTFTFTGTCSTTNSWSLGAGGGTIANANSVTLSGNFTGTGSLVKSGAGTLTLSGSSSRTGSTTVSAGTLSLTTPSLSPATDVTLIDGDATLNLDFNGTAIIDELYLSGSRAQEGVWGGVGSGATFIHNRITGSGTLTVTSGPPSFDLFLATYFTPGEIAAGILTTVSADPDGDGLANFLEYAFELNPRVSNSAVTTLDATSGYLTLTYPRRTDDENEEMTYIVEVSSDLVTWYSGITYTEELSSVPIADTNHELVTERDLTALSTATRRFIRVRIAFD